MNEELTTGTTLLVTALIVWVEEMEDWEDGDWIRGCEEVTEGKFDVTSLVSNLDLDIENFLRCDSIGNSKGGIPSLSLLDWVNIPVSLNREVALSSEASRLTGFSVEIDIPSNFWIKD